MENNILIRDWDKLDKGFLKCCDVVAETFGAEGKLVLLDNNSEAPLLTKDGFHVSERIRFFDKTMNFGALQAIKGAAMTLLRSGDSTTTTMILQQGYVRGIKREDFNKAVEIGVYKAIDEVYTHLKKLSKMPTKKDLEKIARIACNNDKKLANYVLEAFKIAGDAQIVEVDKNIDSMEVRVIDQNGMVIENGFASPFFYNDQDTMTFKGENCSVLCSATWNKDINLVNKIKDFYRGNPKETPLLVVLEKPSSEMTEFLISMKRSFYNVCCVAITAYSEYDNVTTLEDIALMCGGEVYTPSSNPDHLVLGLAEKVTISETKSTFSVGVKSDKLVSVLKSLQGLEKINNKTKARIKRLTAKAALIEVGGYDPADINEKKDRVDDCVASLKTTAQEGWIPGGGSTLAYISSQMNTNLGNKSQQRGYNLVKSVLQEPFKRILYNSNRQMMFETFNPEFGRGYNAITDEITNMVEDGVLDSTKSIRVAIESATETAIKFLNTSAVVHFPSKLGYED